MISENTRMKRIWGNVKATSAEGCWDWMGAKSGDGYGQILVKEKRIRAHRFFYEKLIEKIPEDKVVDHTCRNILCVNPSHMEIVSLEENTRRIKSKCMIANSENRCVNGHKRNRKSMRVKLRTDGTIAIYCRICSTEKMRVWRSGEKK